MAVMNLHRDPDYWKNRWVANQAMHAIGAAEAAAGFALAIYRRSLEVNVNQPMVMQSIERVKKARAP